MNLLLCSLLIGTLFFVDTGCKSIDEQIIDAATKPEMLDFFHILPSGEINILTEYDLKFTLQQYREMFLEDDYARSKRKANTNLKSRWPNATVYYEIMPSLDSPDDRRVITEALAEWHNFTCLEFIENKTSYRRILFDDGNSCSSYVGMQSSPQTITLSPGCRIKGVVVHEIGHAIGWFHEHTRVDRDKYIEFNAEERLRVHFRIPKTSNHFGVPYDYLSIMHYGGAMWPIVTKDPDYQDKIGQISGLSFKDIKLANMMYQCSVVGQCPEQKCSFNGFVLSKSYNGQPKCQCWCESVDINQPLVLCSSIDREAPQPAPQSTKALGDEPCHDLRQDCPKMKSDGLCMFQMELMVELCALTCEFCGRGKNLCMDHEKSCRILAAAGQCQALEEVMKILCPASCGQCKNVADPCTIMLEMMGSSVSRRVLSQLTFIPTLFVNYFLTQSLFLYHW